MQHCKLLHKLLKLKLVEPCPSRPGCLALRGIIRLEGGKGLLMAQCIHDHGHVEPAEGGSLIRLARPGPSDGTGERERERKFNLSIQPALAYEDVSMLESSAKLRMAAKE